MNQLTDSFVTDPPIEEKLIDLNVSLMILIGMKITSHQLEAFYETAKLKSFSKAAVALAVTQSALSQRVAKLEEDLGVTLFIRDSAGPTLTPAGEMLLRHCQVTDSLEQEVLGQLKASSGELGGVLRVAAYSSVLRSVVIPALAPLLRANPQIAPQFKSYEMNELNDVLKTAEADFVIVDHRLNKSGVAEIPLGEEEYLVIESAKYETPIDLYLDHDVNDTATADFFRGQGPKKYRRAFMGDVYGIINGVELGLGRAVMSHHLIEDNSKIKIVRGSKRHTREVVLHHFEQPYYSRLHQEVAGHLQTNARRYL